MMNQRTEMAPPAVLATFWLLKIGSRNIDSARAPLRKIAGAGAALEYTLHIAS
jgi:hypothetical protein